MSTKIDETVVVDLFKSSGDRKGSGQYKGRFVGCVNKTQFSKLVSHTTLRKGILTSKTLSLGELKVIADTDTKELEKKELRAVFVTSEKDGERHEKYLLITGIISMFCHVGKDLSDFGLTTVDGNYITISKVAS